MLVGSFNIHLLKYDTNAGSTAFSNSIYANFYLHYITTPTRVTTHSKTFIDNIFLNNTEDGIGSFCAISIFYFFNCYLAVPRPTLDHSQGDSLTNPMLITAFVQV